MFTRIKTYLLQPYPYEYNIRRSLKTAGLAGIFIFLFLYIFQPFNLNQITSPFKPLIIFGFGIVTFVVLLFHSLMLPKIFPKSYQEERWTILLEILHVLVIIFTIGLGNMIYSSLVEIAHFNWLSLIVFQIYTLLVGVFPVTITIAAEQFFYLKQNLKAATELNRKLNQDNQEKTGKLRELILSDENEKETIKLDFVNLLFIKSVSNYVEVYFTERNKIRKSLLRSTLSRLEEKITEYPTIFRCHRTYIVNLKNVHEITGNSQGYRLILSNCNYEIPVARSYTKKLKEVIAN